MGGTIGIIGMSAWMGGYSTIYPATAIMLVTVLYGGIVLRWGISQQMGQSTALEDQPDRPFGSISLDA